MSNSSDSSNPAKTGAVMRTFVPGHDPIELYDYYREFETYYPYCELQTKRWFVDNAKPDWVIFDVGANIGYYSVLFSQLAPRGHVYAFEPTSTLVKLTRNLSNHRVDNVTVEALALGAQCGAYEDAIFRIRGQDPEREVYFFETIDNYVKTREIKRVDCIKIDTDSFDFEVLRGARNTLKSFNPWVVVELNHALSRRNQSVTEALAWLEDLGYREAVVLDHDNYVLKRRGNFGATGFSLHFDRRQIQVANALRRVDQIKDGSDTNPVPHNGALIEARGEAWSIQANVPAWAYAAMFQLNEAKLASHGAPAVIGVDIECFSGQIGVAFVTADLTEYVGDIVSIDAAPGVQQINLPWKPGAAQLLIRNNDPNGQPVNICVQSVSAYSAIPVGNDTSDYLLPDTKTIDVDDLREHLGRINKKSAPTQE